MRRAGADPNRVRFATIGTNLLDALRLGQVDAGMVQEPALSLITEAGGGVILQRLARAGFRVRPGRPPRPFRRGETPGALP